MDLNKDIDSLTHADRCPVKSIQPAALRSKRNLYIIIDYIETLIEPGRHTAYFIDLLEDGGLITADEAAHLEDRLVPQSLKKRIKDKAPEPAPAHQPDQTPQPEIPRRYGIAEFSEADDRRQAAVALQRLYNLAASPAGIKLAPAAENCQAMQRAILRYAATCLLGPDFEYMQ